MLMKRSLVHKLVYLFSLLGATVNGNPLYYLSAEGFYELVKFSFSGGHTCHTVSDRNKAQVEDFYSLVKSDTKYSDS